jgi:hypothetical protein
LPGWPPTVEERVALGFRGWRRGYVDRRSSVSRCRATVIRWRAVRGTLYGELVLTLSARRGSAATNT